MGTIRIEKRHELGEKGALAAAKKLSARIGRKFGAEGKWHGSVYELSGDWATGKVKVTGTRVVCTIDLGIWASPFAAEIRKGLKQTLDEHFG